MNNTIKIHVDDNAAVALEPLKKGQQAMGITLKDDIAFGHKFALSGIKKGENVIKYGYPIGSASQNIEEGEWVHSHNLKTNLSDIVDYTYSPDKGSSSLLKSDDSFKGYLRRDGSVGIRNEIWVIPTVGCVNKTAQLICEKANKLFSNKCDGVFAFTHPYGCSQLGDDHKNTQKILSGLAKHPNAAGVLLLSLGCENNNLNEFLPVLGDYDKLRIRTLITQNEDDEIQAGLKIIQQLADNASKLKRESFPLSRLTIGFKCGGSDAFSGITANPLCGRLTDRLASSGGKVILTEVPEMFGAETILMNRAKNRNVFNSIVSMINDFKAYFIRHNQPVYENPSPGNKDGGITTLEEKSLGCIQKGGKVPVNAVLNYGESCVEQGLNLLTGPGNDIVSCTNLTASGAHMVLFTTGRGTPLGAPVPTLKISTNSSLAKKKENWIDFNAGKILDGESFEKLTDELVQKVIRIANGEEKTKNEINGYREIAILKDGVTL